MKPINHYFRNNRLVAAMANFFLMLLFAVPLIWERLTRKSIDLKNIKKILILEPWALGDLVLMSGILEPLRAQFPQAKITLLCKSAGKELFQNSGLVDQFVECDLPWTKFRGKYQLWRWPWRNLSRMISQLRAESFDVCLDARGDLRNNVLSFLSGSKMRVGYDWTGGGFFLTHVGQNGVFHRVDAWKQILKMIGVEASGAPRLTIAPELSRWADEFLREHGVEKGSLCVGVHPGAGHSVRRWPLAHFSEVAQHVQTKYRSEIFVFVDPQGYGEEIPLKGKFSSVRIPLAQMIALIQKMDLLICNDSSAMHIATAVGTKTLVIYGPGNRDLVGPYGSRNTVVMIEDMPCRPCYDYCRYSEPFCMTKIFPEQAIKALETEHLGKSC